MRFIINGTEEEVKRVIDLTRATCQALGLKPDKEEAKSIIILIGDKPLEVTKRTLTAGIAFHKLKAIYCCRSIGDWENTLLHELIHLLCPHLGETKTKAFAQDIQKWARWGIQPYIKKI